MIDLLLDRLRSLTGRPVKDSFIQAVAKYELGGGPKPDGYESDEREPNYIMTTDFSPDLQAQLDAIPDMVRDEDGDRDYPDSFYRPLTTLGVPQEERNKLMNQLRSVKVQRIRLADQERNPVTGLSPETVANNLRLLGQPHDETLIDSEGIPLRKDLNPDRVTPSCSCCYYDLGNNMEPRCAINPMGDAATCEHFKPR